ncbi:MAG: hypothetical protein V3U03_06745 [Myxococcota bacterium]
MARRTRWAIAFWVVIAAATAGAGEETDAELAQEDRIAELERTVAVLAEELERTRAERAVPEEAELEGRYGMGPAASKVYGVTRGLSIGGYGEGFYRKIVSDANGAVDRADLLRAVVYTGYKFTDNIIFNAEFELEHATTSATASSGGGSFSVELATLDFFLRPWANVRTGLVLLPMGFLNEIHEPPFYYGVNRPDVEQRIIPTTWRENGIGLFGTLLGEQLEYKAYVVNGLNAQGFSSSGLRGGRQKGNRALAEDLAFVGRLDFSPQPGLLLGGSVYTGSSGQNQAGTPSVPTTIWEAHAQYQRRGLHLRSLFSMAHVGDAGSLSTSLGKAPNASIAQVSLGGYGEVAYDIMRWLDPGSQRTLEPFFRFEYIDTQHDVPSGFIADDNQQNYIFTGGLQFRPIANVVLKADYRHDVAKDGSKPDEFNLGFGFIF